MTLTSKATYIKVLTAKIVADMTRYIAYNDVPETPAPIVVGVKTAFPKVWPSANRVIVHRFSDATHTYFRQPSALNSFWVSHGVDRYASFGVRVETVRLAFAESGRSLPG